jgi:hypothetical protein
MNGTHLSPRDKADAEKIFRLKEKIKAEGLSYADAESNAIYACQPFLISLAMGIASEVKPPAGDEFIKMVFLIWEYFKEDTAIRRKMITPEQFERIRGRHIAMMQYAGKEKSRSRKDIYARNTGLIRSRVLLSILFGEAGSNRILAEMNPADKSIFMMGMKCLIECFEEIKYGNTGR